MTCGSVVRDGIALRYFDVGDGLPVLFQHGLGGDEPQVAEVFPAPCQCRRLTLECRGHGGSEVGPTESLSIKTFAEDVIGLADHLGLDTFVVGGISMGAAIALRIVVHRPERVRGLILVRPAWTFGNAPANMQPFAEVAHCLRTDGPIEGSKRFAASAIGKRLQQVAPDNFSSMMSLFAMECNPADVATLLENISKDGPGVTAEQASRIKIPTLVIGNRMDAIHPVAYAALLASTIPGAEFQEVTPKAFDRPAYAAQVRVAIERFLPRIA
jgi:pimeloyl-ACP methyl ester carboxylesterase